MKYTAFNKVTKSKWLDKVTKDLKGKDVNSLNWAWGDLNGTPFYTNEDTRRKTQLDAHKKDNDWIYCQPINTESSFLANKEIINALHNGASALYLGEISQLSASTLDEITNQVQHEFIRTHILLDTDDIVEYAKQLATLINQKNQDVGKCKGSIIIPQSNPLSDLASIVNSVTDYLPAFHVTISLGAAKDPVKFIQNVENPEENAYF